MKIEEIEQKAIEFANSFCNLVCDNGKTNYLSVGNIKTGYIRGAECRQPEIDELVDMIKAVNEFRYPPAELMQKINKLLKKYEQ